MTSMTARVGDPPESAATIQHTILSSEFSRYIPILQLTYSSVHSFDLIWVILHCSSTYIHSWGVETGDLVESPLGTFYPQTENRTEPNQNCGLFGFRLRVRLWFLWYSVFGLGFGFIRKPNRINRNTLFHSFIAGYLLFQ